MSRPICQLCNLNESRTDLIYPDGTRLHLCLECEAKWAPMVEGMEGDNDE